MFDFVKKVFGTKYDRDVKTYMPLVDKTNEFFASYASLSNDELRNKTLEFRERIAEHLKGIDEDIAVLKEQAESTSNFIEAEDLYNQVDELVKERDQELA